MYCYAVIYNSHSGHSNGELVGQKIEQALIKNQYEIELMRLKSRKMRRGWRRQTLMW